jgi:molybdate transport system ATP-binding protein
MLLELSIRRRFGDFSCDFEFTLDHSYCGLFGPSGSGKSSLMNMIAGLLRPDQGRIRLDGVTLFDDQRKINLPPEQRRVGVVFQQAHLFPHMDVRKNLFYGLKRNPNPSKVIDPDKLISILHLEHLLQRGVGMLSGGERQRVALARAILAGPELILLDEPLTGLDSILKYQIIPELRQVFDQFSIPMLFISHDIQEIRMLTEEVLVVRNGRVEAKMATEMLARAGFVNGGQGYINLLDLDRPEEINEIVRYNWSGMPLMLLKSDHVGPGRFTLGSRDIILFKKHPHAGSARNMLHCTVRSTYQTEWLIGVEMVCKGKTLIAEVVPQSVKELGIRPGSEVVAVFKASAFRRLF